MKMTKKFLIGAAIAALVLGLASCNTEVGDINWGNAGSGDGTKTYKVNQTSEETKNTIRGLKKFGIIDRAGATCIVQMFDQSKNTSCGMVGFASYVKEDKVNNTMNFLVTGVTNDHGDIKTYASYFCNVDPTKLSTKNFGVSVTRDSFDETVKTPYEIVILKWPYTMDKAKLENDGTLRVAVDIKTITNGEIKITWYSVPEMPKAGDQSSATFDPSIKGTQLHTVTATTTQLGTKEGAKNGGIWAYANIYPKQTLKGQWDLYNVTWTQTAAAYAEEDSIVPDTVGDIFFQEF